MLCTLQEDMIFNATIKNTYGQRNTKHAQQTTWYPYHCAEVIATLSPPGGNFPSWHRLQLSVTFRGIP